jgi:hypothetical protein
VYTKGETIHKTINKAMDTQNRKHTQNKKTNMKIILKNLSGIIRK